MYSNPWEWGDPGTDGVPMRVILQVQQQMLCTGYERAYVVALLSRFGRHSEELFIVNRNEQIIKAIIARGEQFWRDYVETRTPPPGSEPGDIDVWKRVVRRPRSYAEISTELIENWETLRQARLQADKDEKAALAEVLKHLGDAEGAPIDAAREFTYYQTERTGLDTTKLKAKYPEIYAECSKVTTSRTARISKIK
jgi:predicted phage-related endonuclease